MGKSYEQAQETGAFGVSMQGAGIGEEHRCRAAGKRGAVGYNRRALVKESVLQSQMDWRKQY